MKKAFTLIELLVVIAIIAILAAILFPVFAQAKLAAKKTVDLSNLKQLTTGVQVYLSDSDDTYPLTVPSGLGTSLFTMPADRTASTNPGNRQAFYGNSVYPYVKSWQMYNGPTASLDWNPFGVQTPTPVVSHGYTLNPYLHNWSATASNSPAKSVAYWGSLGDHKIPGYGTGFPLVITKDLGFLSGQAGSEKYRFAQSGATCTSGYGVFSGLDTWKYNAFGNGANLSYMDGHAKYAKFGSTDYPLIVKPDGTWTSYWISNASTQAGDENGCNYSFTLSPTRE